MAYYTYTKDPIGCFVERDTGNCFEYSINNDALNNCNEDSLHKIWVGGGGLCGTTGYRYGTVKKTVAYIVADEDEYGLPVIEKWYLKKNMEYVV